MLRGCLLVLWCTTACVAGDFRTNLDVDGGDAGAFVCDGGPGCEPLGAEDDCNALVQATCGDTCGESPGCAAATLLRAHEPENCAAALDDTQTFPHCQLGACDSLVQKVCGGDPPSDACIDSPGCAPALELQSRTRDPASSQQELAEASEACVQSLEDEDVFAPCP